MTGIKEANYQFSSNLSRTFFSILKQTDGPVAGQISTHVTQIHSNSSALSSYSKLCSAFKQDLPFHCHLMVFFQVLVGPFQLTYLDLGVFQLGLQLSCFLQQSLFLLTAGCLYTLCTGLMLTHAFVQLCIPEEGIIPFFEMLQSFCFDH